MTDYNPAKIIYIVDDIDAHAINKGYYKDLRNDDKTLFLDINKTQELRRYHGVNPILNQAYVYDISSQAYRLLNDSTEQLFSESKIEVYSNIFHYMGATSISGKIVEVSKKEFEIDGETGVVSPKMAVSGNVDYNEKENLSKTISIERSFGRKNIRDYEEIKRYIITRGLNTDIKLKSRLEELKNSREQQLTGTYSSITSLTSNLESILEIGLQISTASL